MAAVLLFLCCPAFATDRDPARAAGDIALARLAPNVCEDVVTDAHAVALFMERAGIAERDLTGRYAGAADGAVRRFRAAADDDEDAACSNLVRRLGQEGVGILDETGMGSH